MKVQQQPTSQHFKRIACRRDGFFGLLFIHHTSHKIIGTGDGGAEMLLIGPDKVPD